MDSFYQSGLSIINWIGLGDEQPIPSPLLNDTSLSLSLCTIPTELLLVVLACLDTKAIGRTSVVCWHLYRTTNVDVLWERRFMAEIDMWDSFESESGKDSLWDYGNKIYSQIFGSEGEPNSTAGKPLRTWKQKYLHQYSRNSEAYKAAIQLRTKKSNTNNIAKLENFDPWTSTNFMKNFSMPFVNQLQIHKILLIGDGHATTAKKLVYGMMWEEISPFKLTTLFPGNEGIGSGVGFEMSGKNLNVSTIKCDAEIFQKIRSIPKWKEQIQETEGLVYVVDADGTPGVMLENFGKIIDPELGIKENVPLLVLVCWNKDTAEEFISSPSEIARILGLENISRKWCVRRLVVETLDGMYQGFEWLVEEL